MALAGADVPSVPPFLFLSAENFCSCRHFQAIEFLIAFSFFGLRHRPHDGGRRRRYYRSLDGRWQIEISRWMPGYKKKAASPCETARFLVNL